VLKDVPSTDAETGDVVLALAIVDHVSSEVEVSTAMCDSPASLEIDTDEL
jgi:hypothetical protein